MNSEFLSVYRDNLRELIEDFVPIVSGGKATYTQLCDYCEYYRALGIAEVLLDANEDAFREALAKSGQMFLAGLSHAPASTIVVSRATPVFDALAVGDNVTAREIAALLPSSASPSVEYLEDFFYVKFILARYVLGNPRADCEGLLTAMREALADAEDPRCDVAGALLAGDQEAFAKSFDELLSAYDGRYQLLLANERLSDEVAATVPHINVEGVALLRFAENQGFQTLSDYRFIPSLVRSSRAVTLPAGSWTRP